MRRAVRISRRLFLGAVRANSKAVLRPMPEEAPVMTMVLPSRRLAAAEEEDIALVVVFVIVPRGVLRGDEAGR